MKGFRFGVFNAQPDHKAAGEEEVEGQTEREEEKENKLGASMQRERRKCAFWSLSTLNRARFWFIVVTTVFPPDTLDDLC